MKHGFFRFVKSVLFLLALTACIVTAARLLENKDSKIKYNAFFDEARENKLDVLFLGSSHVIDGINPVQLYGEHGITSYNMGGHGSILPATYWELVNALDYCTPKCVVIDTFMLEKDYRYVDVMTGTEDEGTRQASIDQLHLNMDAFPLTKNKAAAVRDLLQDKTNRASFLFDFIKYHSRWSGLSADDYLLLGKKGEDRTNHLFGAEAHFEVEPNIEEFPLLDPQDAMQGETIAADYLRKIISLCQEKGIQVILVQVPFSASEDYQRAGNSAQKIADEFHIPYFNLMYAKNIIDHKSDLSDRGHLNAMGQYKVTAYLGNALGGLGILADHRGDPSYREWEDAQKKWQDTILDAACNPSDLYSELMTLQFPEVSSIIFINRSSNAFYDSTLIRLIEKLSGTRGIEAVSKSHRSYCLVHDSAKGNTVETLGNVPIKDFDASFGKVNFVSPDENYNLLSVGDDLTDNLLDYTNNGNIDVQILVYDNQTHALIRHLYFDYAGMRERPDLDK